jgi:hypothetical protein
LEHKALTQATLAPGEKIGIEWPMRPNQAGDYRVVISAVERGSPRIVTSPFVDFYVERKPVVESRRILPVAFGVPLPAGRGPHSRSQAAPASALDDSEARAWLRSG